MSIWKKFVCCTLVFALLLPFFAVQATAEEATPSLSAYAYAMIEASSGDAVLAKNEAERLPMASTTKIATAAVALSLASPDTLITVHEDAVGVEGSSVYLTAGEQLTLEALLYAMLLESANDAALAIAYGVSGSVAAFADQMNLYAQSLGLRDTHFTNPHGLYDEAHYTTARELAQLTRHALQNDVFARIVATRKTTVSNADAQAERLLINHNKLLRSFEGCIGVKTGYTKKSGRCLVSAAERNGVTLIAVTLNAPDDWNDHTKMLEHGFARFVYKQLSAPGELLFPLSVVGGEENYVMVSNEREVGAVLPTGHGSTIVRLEVPRFLWAQINEGECVGKAVFYCDLQGNGVCERIGEVDLIAAYGVRRSQPRKSLWQWLLSLFS